MGRHDKIIIGLIVFMAIFAVVLTVTTYAVIIPQLRDSDADTKEAIHRSEQAEYRICIRQMVNRAALDTDFHGDEKSLPLYDCTPNRIGKPARLMTNAQAKAFAEYVRTTPEDQLP